MKILYILIAIFSLISVSANGAPSKVFTPHFVYIKSGEVNLRAGPSKNYPIKWIIKSKYEPVLAIHAFEDWIKIKDIDGDEGWLNKASVSTSTLGAIVKGKGLTTIYARPQKTSKRMCRLETKVRVKVKKCTKDDWCNISVRDVKGWIPSSSLWGLNKASAN